MWPLLTVANAAHLQRILQRVIQPRQSGRTEPAVKAA